MDTWPVARRTHVQGTAKARRQYVERAFAVGFSTCDSVRWRHGGHKRRALPVRWLQNHFQTPISRRRRRFWDITPPQHQPRKSCSTYGGLWPTHKAWIGRGHDDVIKWKHFPRYWPFVRGIHRWNSRTKAGDAELLCFLRLKKRLSKQWWGWWFETPPRPLWCHCNGGRLKLRVEMSLPSAISQSCLQFCLRIKPQCEKQYGKARLVYWFI